MLQHYLQQPSQGHNLNIYQQKTKLPKGERCGGIKWLFVINRYYYSPLDCKEIQPVNPKGNQSWIFIGRTSCWSLNSNTLATWCEELTHWERPWCWERLKAGGEGDDKGWDGWMASPTRWTWVWVSSGIWWWTEKPGLLQSMGSQRVRHDRAAELIPIFYSCTDFFVSFCNQLLRVC